MKDLQESYDKEIAILKDNIENVIDKLLKPR